MWASNGWLAATLTADVAGYSRMMGRNEAGFLAKLFALPRELDTKDGLHHAAFTKLAAISRFTLCTVPLPTPTSAATFSIPLPALRCVLMAFSIFGETLGRPSFPPCCRTRSRPARLCFGESIFPARQIPTPSGS